MRGYPRICSLINMENTNIINSPDRIKERKRLNKDNVFVNYEKDESLNKLGEGKYYYIYTYGCQENESDSEKIMGLLEEMSYTRTEELEECDLIVMNTCAIRKNAEDKVFGELGRLKKLKRQKPSIVTVLCGCMAQEQDAVNLITRKYQNVDIVLGTHNIHSLPSLIAKCLDKKERLVDVLSYHWDIFNNISFIR